MNKAKIVATIGPASSGKEILREMFKEGLNVARINFSHSNHEDAAQIVHTIRELNTEMGAAVAVLADLQGPKLRVGVVEEGAIVKPGDIVTFKTDQEFVGSASEVYMSYAEFPKDVSKGDRILLDLSLIHI